MNTSSSHFRTPHTSYFIPLILILLSTSITVNAQRLEVHGNYDLSTNNTSHKVWGCGTAVDFDQWVKNVVFRANFNWGMSREKNNSAAFNFIPTYLIPVGTKSNIPTFESEYKKGIWLFQLQLGLSYKLFKPD